MNTFEQTSIMGYVASRLAPKRDAHACDAATFERAHAIPKVSANPRREVTTGPCNPEGVGESTKGGDDGKKTKPVVIR